MARTYNLHLGGPPKGLGGTPAATPRQVARLSFLGVLPKGSISMGLAGALIDRTEDDPKFANRIAQWHSSKYKLHPELYPASEQSVSEAMTAPFYERDLDQRKSGWFLPVCVAAVLLLAATFYAGFREHAAPIVPQPSAATSAPTPTIDRPAPIVIRPTMATVAPTPTYQQSVAISQRRAVQLYPELGVEGSHFNSAFIARYQMLVAHHDPLFNSPTWPEELATRCAKDLPAKYR